MSVADNGCPPSGIWLNPHVVLVSFITSTLASGDPGTTSGVPMHGTSVPSLVVRTA